jgi:hypothetical protein
MLLIIYEVENIFSTSYIIKSIILITEVLLEELD